MIPRHIMIKTICKNYLGAGVITKDDIEHTRDWLEQFTDDVIVCTLVESHMLNPLNLEQHVVRYVGAN